MLLLLVLSPTPCFERVLNTVWYNDSKSARGRRTARGHISDSPNGDGGNL